MIKELVTILGVEKILEKEFTIYGTKENPLFLAKDIAEMIEHTDTSKMVKTIDEDEKVKNIIPTLGGNQEMLFLTEDGMMEVLMQSRKIKAKEFKKEIKFILKEIRRNGCYINPNATVEQKDGVKYNINMLDVTFINCPLENVDSEYKDCMEFHEDNNTRFEYKKSSKTRRSDKLKSHADTKIEIMKKILEVIAARKESLHSAGLREELVKLEGVINVDIKTIQHNKTRGKLAGKNR